jgi:hypothetical protein
VVGDDAEEDGAHGLRAGFGLLALGVGVDDCGAAGDDVLHVCVGEEAGEDEESGGEFVGQKEDHGED